MDLRKIEALWAHVHWLTVLAEQGTFTAAAARLGVSKAAMSQRVNELERAAGVPLVQRTTRSVRLTEAGQRLADETRSHYEEIARSFASVRDSAGEIRGVLRVTAPVAFARQQLVPRLSGFLGNHPEVRLQLELSDRLSALATEGFDLAIRHSATVPETHVAWTLCSTHSVLVASSDYLDRQGVPMAPDDLRAHQCLYYPRGHDAPAWTFEREGKRSRPARVTVPISGPLAANNSDALRDAAMTGLGIALLPDFSAQSALRDAQLLRVLPGWRPVGAFAEQLYAIRPYSATVPRTVGAFVTYLRNAFAPGFGVATAARRERS